MMPYGRGERPRQITVVVAVPLPHEAGSRVSGQGVDPARFFVWEGSPWNTQTPHRTRPFERTDGVSS